MFNQILALIYRSTSYKKTCKMKTLPKIKKATIMLAAITIGMLSLNDCKNDDNDTNNASGVDLMTVADGYVSPIGVVSVPDNTNRLFVIDQVGKIMIIGADGKKVDAPFLDHTSMIVPLNAQYDERGLLGVAVHPDYQNNGRFFVYYQLPPRSGGPDAANSWDNLSR